MRNSSGTFATKEMNRFQMYRIWQILGLFFY